MTQRTRHRASLQNPTRFFDARALAKCKSQSTLISQGVTTCRGRRWRRGHIQLLLSHNATCSYTLTFILIHSCLYTIVSHIHTFMLIHSCITHSCVYSIHSRLTHSYIDTHAHILIHSMHSHSYGISHNSDPYKRSAQFIPFS